VQSADIAIAASVAIIIITPCTNILINFLKNVHIMTHLQFLSALIMRHSKSQSKTNYRNRKRFLTNVYSWKSIMELFIAPSVHIILYHPVWESKEEHQPKNVPFPYPISSKVRIAYFLYNSRQDSQTLYSSRFSLSPQIVLSNMSSI
jgi:hypothetical protein